MSPSHAASSLLALHPGTAPGHALQGAVLTAGRQGVSSLPHPTARQYGEWSAPHRLQEEKVGRRPRAVVRASLP